MSHVADVAARNDVLYWEWWCE